MRRVDAVEDQLGFPIIRCDHTRARAGSHGGRRFRRFKPSESYCDNRHLPIRRNQKVWPRRHQLYLQRHGAIRYSRYPSRSRDRGHVRGTFQSTRVRPRRAQLAGPREGSGLTQSGLGPPSTSPGRAMRSLRPRASGSPVRRWGLVIEYLPRTRREGSTHSMVGEAEKAFRCTHLGV